jgi:hypothetical protein
MHILDYKRNYALDNVPEELNDQESIIYNLVDEMANDDNSSKFREDITLDVCEYESSPGKLGEDGIDPRDGRKIEVKPQNGHNKNNKNKKLNGGGQFTDFTHSRIKKYKDNDISMVVSGFHEGKLKFIVQFDYTSPTFLEHITKKVCKSLPNGDESSKYCRSASFGWNQWKDAQNLKLMYLSDNLDNTMISGPLLKFLHTLNSNL